MIFCTHQKFILGAVIQPSFFLQWAAQMIFAWSGKTLPQRNICAFLTAGRANAPAFFLSCQVGICKKFIKNIILSKNNKINFRLPDEQKFPPVQFSTKKIYPQIISTYPHAKSRLIRLFTRLSTLSTFLRVFFCIKATENGGYPH